MSEDSENPDEVQLKEGQKKKIREGPIELKIENQTVLDQQQMWDELRETIRDEYQELNIPFDPSSITNKKEMEHHVAVLKHLKNAKEEFMKENKMSTPSGTPLTGQQYGETEPTSDRNIEALKETMKGIPLDMVEFHSEKEMKDVLNAIADDSNDPRRLEAQKLRAKLLGHSTQKSQTLELEGSLKDALHGKAKFKKKGQIED